MGYRADVVLCLVCFVCFLVGVGFWWGLVGFLLCWVVRLVPAHLFFHTEAVKLSLVLSEEGTRPGFGDTASLLRFSDVSLVVLDC